MCAPTLMAAVRRDVSRRSFLATFGGSVAAASLPAAVTARQKPLRLEKGFTDVVDLTHTFSSRPKHERASGGPARVFAMV